MRNRQMGLLCGAGVLLILFLVWNPFGFALPWAAAPADDDETVLDASTFVLNSYTDGEDVSDFTEISIWVPEDDVTFDDYSDICTLSNFEEEVQSKVADTVSIDLSGYQYVWIEIDPDDNAVFETNFHLLASPSNGLYTFNVFHLSSDFNFNVLDKTTMDEWDTATDGNYTVFMMFPAYTEIGGHNGTDTSDDWDVTDDDVTDFSESEKLEHFDEANFRCQAPTYSPTLDNEKDYADDLEKLTEAFAIKFTFNDTINLTDSSITQVNFTITSDDSYIESIISGAYIYVVYTIPILSPESFDFEIQLAANITCSSVHSGRLLLPEDDHNLGAFTAYSAMGA